MDYHRNLPMVNLPTCFLSHGKVGRALAFLSPFTWTSGENYLAVIARNGGPEVVDEYAKPIMEGYKKILLCLGGTQLGYVTAAYISCDLEEKKIGGKRWYSKRREVIFWGYIVSSKPTRSHFKWWDVFTGVFFKEFKYTWVFRNT